MGYLHNEQSVPRSEETKFTFASPLHRRVAHRCLISHPEQDAIDNLSLQDTCSNAIARFSPGALRSRQDPWSSRNWGIPEAAFQDELYCCLNLELRCLPILSDYSHTKDGRIDFYVADRKWGIELLQCGNTREIAVHTARFGKGGRYQERGIMDDLIILNFCPRSALRKVRINDKKIQSHFFHVVIEPNEFVAEIYTYDTQLVKPLSLGEGRQRANTYDFLGSNNQLPQTEARPSPSQEETMLRVQATTNNLKKLKQEIQRKDKEVKRKDKEMLLLKLQMQKEKEEMRLQMQSDNDRSEPIQEQDKLISGPAERKRKR